MTDEELETAIRDEYEAMLKASTMKETRERLEKMAALVHRRSARQKAKMERKIFQGPTS